MSNCPSPPRATAVTLSLIAVLAQPVAERAHAATELRIETVAGDVGETVAVDVTTVETDEPCLGGVAFSVVLGPGLSLRSVESLEPDCLAESADLPGGPAIGLICASGLADGARPLRLNLDVAPDAFDGNASVAAAAVTGSTCAGAPTAAAIAEGGVVVGTVPCAVSGDVFPDTVGDAGLDLRDFLLARRKTVLGSETIVARDFACADLGPGSFACETSDPPAWCPMPDGRFRLDDLEVLRGVVAGAKAISCEPCLSGDPAADGTRRAPGDVAPRGATDGVVDVSDVVTTLRFAVRLDVPDAEEALRGNVAPNQRVDGLVVPTGGGIVDPTLGLIVPDVSDVVTMLRAAVRLDVLAWPERFLGVTIDDRDGVVGYRVAIGSWPPWAAISRFDGEGCADAGGGLDEADGTCTFTCATDPQALAGTGDLLRVGYRGIEGVDPGDLVLANEIADAGLDLDQADLAVVTRDGP